MEKMSMYAIYFSDRMMAYIMASSAEEAVRSGIFRLGDNGKAIAEVDIAAVMVGMNQPGEGEAGR